MRQPGQATGEQHKRKQCDSEFTAVRKFITTPTPSVTIYKQQNKHLCYFIQEVYTICCIEEPICGDIYYTVTISSSRFAISIIGGIEEKKMEEHLRLLYKRLDKCQVCNEVMMESKAVRRCSLKEKRHTACTTCSTKDEECTQCKKPAKDIATTTTKISENKMNCCYHNLGCEFILPEDAMIQHQTECKYRTHVCPGKYTKVIKQCNWKGKASNILEHFQNRHPENAKQSFGYKTTDVVSTRHTNELQMFMSHNKLFQFVYHFDKPKHKMYFLISVFATKKTAEKYCYEFEIFKPGDNIRKIKYVEICESDAVPTVEMFALEKCIVLSETYLKRFIHEEKIHFRFWIKTIELVSENTQKRDVTPFKHCSKPFVRKP